jgi:hypothetical protein
MSMDKKDLQKEKILAYMKKGKGITQKEAVELFGCYRLSARIADLRRDYAIVTKTEPNKGRGYHARYFLKEVDDV